MIELLLHLIKAAVARFVIDETVASTYSLSEWLVARSAKRLHTENERYLEQWSADLADRRTPLRKLLFAFSIVRASFVMRHDAIYPGTPILDGIAVRFFDTSICALAILGSSPILLLIFLSLHVSRRFRGSAFCNTFPGARGRMVYREATLVFSTRDANGRPTRVGALVEKFGWESMPMLFLVVSGRRSLFGRRPMTFTRTSGGIEEQYLEPHRIEVESDDPHVLSYIARPPGIAPPSVFGVNDNDAEQGIISLRNYFRCWVGVYARVFKLRK